MVHESRWRLEQDMVPIDKGKVFPLIVRQGFNLLIVQNFGTATPVYDDLAYADVLLREDSLTMNV
jgi:hypothetical protein